MILLPPNKTDSQLERELFVALGDGPVRFGPIHQETTIPVMVEERGLSKVDVTKYAMIKITWESEHKKKCKKQRLSNVQILRVALYCNFDEGKSIRLLQKTSSRYFELSALDLEKQLRTKTLFPCPNLRTIQGHDVFYMRPSRFLPKTMSTNAVIDNLIYVMNHMTSRPNSKGVAFLANMEGWTMTNFNYEYCRKFMLGLQGRYFPARVSCFLILNPPAWFGKVWAVMQTMLSPEFAKKVRAISDDELPYFLAEGFETYLPDEVPGGEADTDELVSDFVAFRQFVEQSTKPKAVRRGSIGATFQSAIAKRRFRWFFCRRTVYDQDEHSDNTAVMNSSCHSVTSPPVH